MARLAALCTPTVEDCRAIKGSAATTYGPEPLGISPSRRSDINRKPGLGASKNHRSRRFRHLQGSAHEVLPLLVTAQPRQEGVGGDAHAVDVGPARIKDRGVPSKYPLLPGDFLSSVHSPSY